MKPQNKKDKISKKSLVILGIIILVFVIVLVIFFVFISKKDENKNNITYDNIDNYNDVSVEIDAIEKSGIIFSNFYTKTSKDAQILNMTVKNNTDSDISNSRKYQICVIGKGELNDSREIFYVDNLKAGEEQMLSISISNIVNNIIEIYIDEF